MGRTPRRPSATGYYHVVTRGNNRQRIFREAADYQRYLRLLATTLAPTGGHLAHYCLMPNHTHLLLTITTVTALSQLMHELQRRYWFAVRRTYALTGHLWQGRFHSFPIEDDGYLLEAARYLERNPLHARLVTDLADYPWSSYPYYAEGQTREVVLTPSPGYEALGLTPAARQAAWRQYVTADRPYDAAVHQTIQEAARVGA